MLFQICVTCKKSEEPMPIKMNCPSCNKTLSSPDSAAGKNAKCPACGTVMVVPTGVFDAGEPGAAGPPPAPPEFNVADDVPAPPPATSPATSPFADSAAPGQEPPRRPCPSCGEPIVANAAKCRFCGAVFDPRLRATSCAGPGWPSYQGFAITSMILGILALISCYCGPIFGIAAIIFAVVANNGMKTSGNLNGKGMATAGLVMGIIGTVLGIIWAILAAIGMSTAQHGGPRPF